jgi:hypothetical protein
MRRLRVSVPVLSISRTSDALAAAELDLQLRLERKYRRRRLVRQIDDAIDECERANLAGAGGEAPPARAAALVEELQLDAGEPVRRPETAARALDELFRLIEPYLLTSRFLDNDEDQVADVDAGPRSSAR